MDVSRAAKIKRKVLKIAAVIVGFGLITHFTDRVLPKVEVGDKPIGSSTSVPKFELAHPLIRIEAARTFFTPVDPVAISVASRDVAFVWWGHRSPIRQSYKVNGFDHAYNAATGRPDGDHDLYSWDPHPNAP